MSKGQTSGEKIEEMLENRRNKRIQRKLPIGPNQHKFRGKQFQQNLLERMERQDNHFREVCKFTRERAYFTQTMTQAFLMIEQIMNQCVPHNQKVCLIIHHPPIINHQILVLQ